MYYKDSLIISDRLCIKGSIMLYIQVQLIFDNKNFYTTNFSLEFILKICTQLLKNLNILTHSKQ